MAIESIIPEENSKLIILCESLSTIKIVLNQFEPGGMAVQNNPNKAAEQGREITILYRISGH